MLSGTCATMAPKKTLTASEIQAYAYCPRAWAYGKLGYLSGNRRKMEEGSEFHRSFGTRDRLRRVLLGLIIIAMLILLFFIIRRFLI